MPNGFHQIPSLVDVFKRHSATDHVSMILTILLRVDARPENPSENQLTYGDISLSLDRFECIAGDQRIDLTPVEFKILQGFITRPGHVFSRDRLMDIAYADERVVSDRTIDTHVKNLRRKLATAQDSEEVIHSIYGVGYKID